MYKIDYVYKCDFSYNQNQVLMFAEITGDNNPIHLDDDYASKSIFKQKIIHGFLGASIFSKVFGTIFPGIGSIYLSQTMAFYRPMFVDVLYTANFKIISKDIEKKQALISTIITNSEGKNVIVGEAIIIHKDFAINL